ncbi:SprT family protein [Aquibacillus rhizosphaerae]|uniref:Protein SprT-like n=1 Tax=Aquibacillus rhizosphaerae TaxID=3051431 RepID=A0ABT7KZR9_9BACI|nr:SprT family protein [Aquibacillus sp. LR5S19]MDL4839049.1 SprT family protein [Aquibacillus sp. LR5S19]
MVNIQQDELEQIVNEISQVYFNKPFLDKVLFNYRLKTTGGRYIPSRRTIELNPKYPVELGEEEFFGIIKHELCHYHLHIEGKGYSHRDLEFKELLKRTGSPRFCQPLPSMKKQGVHKYICLECSQEYYRRRVINTKKYRCGKCKGKLKKHLH